MPLTHPAFLLLIAIAAACVAVTVTFRFLDTDFWQHLAVGREILREGRVPTTQIWTWPLYGRPDVTPSWGFRVLLWLFWKAGAMPGLFVWRWLTTLLAFGFAWAAARRMGAAGMAVLVVVAWAALPYRLRAEPRPESLVLVLMAIQLWIHAGLRRTPLPASAWRSAAIALPALALVWANVHISYWVGLALQGIFLADTWLAGRRDRARAAWVAPLAWMLALSAAASLLNPGGWRALAQPFQYWLTWRHELIFRQIGELEPVAWRENARNLLWAFVAGWPLLILLRARRAGADAAEILIAAMFLYLGLSSKRFLSYFAVAAVPFVARDLAEILSRRRLPRALASPWSRAALAGTLCAAGSLAEWANPVATRGFGVEPEWRPVAACDFIERAGIRGRAYNHFEFGGYLLWRFHPQRDRLPFIDIHVTATPEDRQLAALVLDREDAWAALDRRHHFDWVLFNRFRSGQDRSTDILDADTSFALVFLDDVSAVYVRRSGPMAGIADSLRYRVLHGGFERAAGIAEAFADSIRRPAVRAELERLTAGSPFHATAYSLEANFLFRQGRLAEAREALRSALAIDPHFPFANSRLAEVALRLNLPAEALAAVRAAIAEEGLSDRLDRLRFEARTGARGRPAAPPIARVPLPDEWPRKKQGRP